MKDGFHYWRGVPLQTSLTRIRCAHPPARMIFRTDASKRATVDYLRRHFKDDVSLQKIYRYMDKLYDTQKERVQEISVRHTRQLFGGNWLTPNG